jgi:hypothetical protein
MENSVEAANHLFRDFDMMEVAYEDFASDQSKVVDAAARFLGSSQDNSSHSSLLKLTSDDLSVVLENYRQVQSVLAGTRFERFLTESRG